MRKTTTEIGRCGENAVCQQLLQQGYTIVQQNFCIRGGEIDIIAQNSEYLAFVEVKTRRPNSMVSGYDAVTKQKRTRLIRAAAFWCKTHPTTRQPRFDVACVCLQGTAVVSIEYLENAFDATGCDFIF